MTRTWRVGDLKPDLKVKLSNGDDETFNAEEADEITVVGVRSDGTTAFRKTPPSDVTFVDPYSTVTVLLAADDTATADTIDIEVELVWSDGKRQTVEVDRGMIIEDDLES